MRKREEGKEGGRRERKRFFPVTTVVESQN